MGIHNTFYYLLRTKANMHTVLVSFVSLTQTIVTWEERTSVEKLPN